MLNYAAPFATVAANRSEKECRAIAAGSQSGLTGDLPGTPPRIIGHRGARGEMPENTLESLDHVYAAGIRAMEIDVQTSADRVPMTWHDPCLMPDKVRGKDGSWVPEPGVPVAGLTASELGTFRVGQLRQGGETRQRFPEQAGAPTARISRLEDICRWVADHRDVFLNVEIKSFHHVTGHGDQPDTLARVVTAELQAHGLTGRVLVTSFDWRVLAEVRRIAPDLPTGCLSQIPAEPEDFEQNIYPGSVWMNGAAAPSGDRRLPTIAHEQGAAVWLPYHLDLAEQDLLLAHALGLQVIVWTVNDRGSFERLSALGVDGIITDYPTRVQIWQHEIAKATASVIELPTSNQRRFPC